MIFFLQIKEQVSLGLCYRDLCVWIEVHLSTMVCEYPQGEAPDVKHVTHLPSIFPITVLLCWRFCAYFFRRDQLRAKEEKF